MDRRRPDSRAVCVTPFAVTKQHNSACCRSADSLALQHLVHIIPEENLQFWHLFRSTGIQFIISKQLLTITEWKTRAHNTQGTRARQVVYRENNSANSPRLIHRKDIACASQSEPDRPFDSGYQRTNTGNSRKQSSSLLSRRASHKQSKV